MNSAIGQRAIVFALTSQGSDHYSAMTRLAIASLRQSNPGFRLIVVCDQETDLSVKRQQDPLIDEADEWIALETPGGNAFFRSRFVKTSLRNIVDGPFLFLDSDVFVRGNLIPVFELNADIAGAPNHSRASFSEQVWEYDADTLKAMGWRISGQVYLNTGVLFFNDTDKARELNSEWHRRWLNSYHSCGKHQDQPAFNSALHVLQPRISVMPDRYNAQFKVTPAVARDAVLWHYYGSTTAMPQTRYELFLEELTSGVQLDKNRIAAIRKSRHPWRRDSVIDDWAAAGIFRRNRYDGWEFAWLCREMKKYILNRLSATIHQVKQITVRR